MVKKTQGLRPVDHLVPYRNDSYLTNPHIECVKFSWLVLFFYNKVSSLVTMYSHLGDVNAAVAVLDDAVEFAQKNKVSKEECSWVVHLSLSWQPLRFFVLYGGKSCLSVEYGPGRTREIPHYNLSRIARACHSRVIIRDITKGGHGLWTNIQERAADLFVRTTWNFFIFQHTMRQSEVLTLMRENVAYKLHHGKAKEAVDMLEKLHK